MNIKHITKTLASCFGTFAALRKLNFLAPYNVRKQLASDQAPQWEKKNKKRSQTRKNQIGEQSDCGGLERLVLSKLDCAGIVLINYLTLLQPSETNPHTYTHTLPSPPPPASWFLSLAILLTCPVYYFALVLSDAIKTMTITNWKTYF